MALPPPPPSDADDSALLRAAARGHADAFRTLYFRHREFVFRIARRYSAHDDDALDAAQDTFIYLLKKLPTLHLSARLSTYLYPIAKNMALARQRRQQSDHRADTLRLHSDSREALSPPASALPLEANPALAAALAELSDDLREVLLMRLVEEMTIEEVATALEIPLGTVKSRLHNALARLRADPRLANLLKD